MLPLHLETAHDGALLSAGNIDGFVEELLIRIGCREPPVDAFRVAREVGLSVLTDCGMVERGRRQIVGGTDVIFVRPEPRPERLQWTVAHELGEALFVSPSADSFDEDDDLSRAREEFANTFAARLLLPQAWLRSDFADRPRDLCWFKQRYATASCELIVTRWLDLVETAIVSIFDQRRLTRRAWRQPRRPPPLQPGERACLDQLWNQRRPAVLVNDSLHIHGWPIDEAGWCRDILWTEPAAEEFGVP
jgi:hypothetical protein